MTHPSKGVDDGTNPFDNDALFARSWPKLDEAQAAALAREAFGIAGQASLLTSERDQNFRIDGDGGLSFVLKITHPAEDPGVTDFQTQAQLHLMRSDTTLPIPHLVSALDGSGVYWRSAPGTDARQAVRLITFVPGVPLHKVTRTRMQRRALGKALARMDRALASFTHAHANHRLLWDLQHLAQLRPLLACILASLIPFIVSTTCDTTSPPRAATLDACFAS